MKPRRFIKKVSIEKDNDDYLVKIAAGSSVACLCVCNGMEEAEVVASMVMAVASNTQSQRAISTATKKLQQWAFD